MYGKFLIVALLCLTAACERDDPGSGEKLPLTGTGADCAADNAGLFLPDGFCAKVVADNLGFIRHFVVHKPGHLFVTQRNRRLRLGGLMSVRDSDADGNMDEFIQLGNEPGMGIGLSGDYLYFSSETALFRYRVDVPVTKMAATRELVVSGFPHQDKHAGKPFTMDGQGNIYINVGAPSNVCQVREDEPGVAGEDPCGQLQQGAGIWRFTMEPGQSFSSGKRYASGIRNAYALDWHTELQALYLVQHGRDGLHELWPDMYGQDDGSELPAEVMLRVEEDGVYGWPYCYFDPRVMRWITAPEYGGDGKSASRCGVLPAPVLAFPAHYGPNDLLIYPGGQFPGSYQHGAFVAFHGSYNRGPFEQVGYQVIYIPFRDDGFAGWTVFADGFAGKDPVITPEDAEYRPTGLAVDSSGALYVSDSVHGRIWRISFTGPPMQ